MHPFERLFQREEQREPLSLLIFLLHFRKAALLQSLYFFSINIPVQVHQHSSFMRQDKGSAYIQTHNL